MKTTLPERLKLFRKELRLTQDAVAARLGIGKSALSMIETGHTALSARNRDLLIRAYGINPSWLDNGLGPMLTEPKEGAESTKDLFTPLPIPEGGSRYRQIIPLYETAPPEGLSQLLHHPETIQPTNHLQIPGLPRCDGALRIHDDGMSPLLRRGDLALYRSITPETDPFWGDMHLLGVEMEDEEYITVRYLRPGKQEGSLELRGADPTLPGREIDRNRIRAMARIVAGIRIGGGGL